MLGQHNNGGMKKNFAKQKKEMTGGQLKKDKISMLPRCGHQKESGERVCRR